MPGWLMMGFIIIGLFLLIVILSSITTGKRSPTEAPKASVELSKEALEEHLRQLFYFLNDIKKSGRGLVKYELYNDGKRLLLKIDWVESNWLKIPYGDRESLVRSIHSRWITAFPGRSEILIQGYYSGKELAYSKAGEIYMV